MDEARSASTHREPVFIETDIGIFYYQALDRPDLSPRTRENCLRSLRKICGRHALLPTTLKTPISVERTGDVMFRGGFADVWKGEYCGRDVAIKALRIYSESELQRVAGVSYWLYPLFPRARVLTVPRAEVLQGGCRVENPPTSECPTVDWSDNVRDPVRDDIGLDGEWKYQQLPEGTSRHKPAGTGRRSFQNLVIFTSNSLMFG